MDPATAASDPFLLDWGSSINVNEDLRRSIQSEISSIDKTNAALDKSIRTEQKIAAQSRRDFSYAQAELIQLNRTAGDEEDNAVVNEQIQHRLSDTLRKEIVDVVSPVERREKGVDTVGGESMEVDRSSGSSDTDANTHADTDTGASREVGVTEVAKRAQEIQALKVAIQTKKESLENYRAKEAELKYLLESTAARLAREQKNETTWKHDVEVKRKENDSEKERYRCGKEALYRARKNTGEYTQQRTNCLNELSSKQKTNEQEEERMNQNKESKQKIIDGLSTQVSTLLQTTQAKTEHLDRLHEQIAERETNHSKRQAIQNEMEERKIRLASHRERVEEKRIELEEAEKTLHANKEKLSDVQKKHADLDQEIASGQKEEQEVVAPARKEFPKLLKESEELSRLIAKYREVLTSLKKSAEADLSSKKAILEDVKKQIQEKSNDEQEKEARLASLRESREIANKNALEEIEQQNSLKSKFEEAMSTEAAVIQALKEQREREHEKRVEARRHEFLAEEYKRDLLACGADIIQETKQMEDKYENLPIEA